MLHHTSVKVKFSGILEKQGVALTAELVPLEQSEISSYNVWVLPLWLVISQAQTLKGEGERIS